MRPAGAIDRWVKVKCIPYFFPDRDLKRAKRSDRQRTRMALQKERGPSPMPDPRPSCQ